MRGYKYLDFHYFSLVMPKKYLLTNHVENSFEVWYDETVVVVMWQSIDALLAVNLRANKDTGASDLVWIGSYDNSY